MLSDDAKFESVKSDLARPLRIYRQDIRVGHRLMLYIKDQNCHQEMRETREVVFKFMTDHFDIQIVELTVDEFTS